MNDIDSEDRRYHEELAERINRYWMERGIQANARAIRKTSKCWFRYENRQRKLKNGMTQIYRVRVDLRKPDEVTTWQVVSDLTGREPAKQLKRVRR